ncbi:Rha family transcriptional regulator [Clostridium peptidivorans]|uniref:Rha family transcriptional regulator n=1 Tax=Clostridium peptidivorans TaxID=100174 RepID=UPI000BE453EE|nr:Rha family transcriptional regulator [Clostridium peptidivorans]
MDNLIKILNQDGQLVVTSRQIADDFEKEHRNVVRDIENLISNVGSAQNCAHLFIESEYQHEQNKQLYKEYLLTRDGFSLLVMGFTGAKALQWKLKYIEAFNKMEEHIKNQLKPSCLEDVLIAQLQEMKAMRTQVEQANTKAIEANAKAEETKQEVQAIRDVVALNPNDWRKDSSSLINKMALTAGGYDHIKALREESYKLLEQRMGVQLSIRLTNKRRRMADEGICKSKRDKLTMLDVIQDDKKLIEGYVAIVKEMAIKYGA